MEADNIRDMVPRHPDILEMLVKANSFKLKKRRRKAAFLCDADDIIDLGAPRIPSRQIKDDTNAPPRRRRFAYVPNPRLYPGPQIKQVEARARPRRKRRRGKRSLLRPVPNSRLYRPAPPRPPPPPPRAPRPPTAPSAPRAPLGTLETASRVALRVGERRQQAPPPAAPAPTPPRVCSAAPPSRRLVVTLPVACSPPAPAPRAPLYRPASEHFRATSAPRRAMDAARRHSASPEDCSDGNEPTSAPSEFLAEFLSAIMRQQYAEALKYCRLILQYEPHNATAQGFYPLLQLKLRQHHPAGGEQRSSSEEGTDADGLQEEEMEQAADESSAGSEARGGGSVASQSSLELDSEPSGEPARTDSDAAASASAGCWDTSSSGERSAADDNGNAPPLHLREEDLENDNATAESHHSTQVKSESPTLSRLRARFTCFIK